MSTVVEASRAGEQATRSSLDRRCVRAALLAAIIVVLQLLIFRGYYSGSTIPPWDFLGGYNSDAYQWWTEGWFFSPVEWIPNVWGGYPASLNIQNSAWYLPVGIASLFGPFTLHSSAVVQALHVAFGVVGVYFLSRSFKVSFPVAVVVAVASFFGVGYFSNAEHVDIARSYALLPWVLLVLSPSWPWKRVWGVALAALILWQSVTGMYPGIIVATVYVGAVWVAVYQWRERPALRQYLLPVAVTSAAAMLLCLPRLLPHFLTREIGGTVDGDGSVFTPAMLGTLLFGYSGDLPNDISMRSFFVPATMLLLAFFARMRHPATAQALALGVPALVLGLPVFPWFAAAQSLPGLGLSRFTMSDFKVFVVLSVLLLAAAGLTSLNSLSGKGPLELRTRVGLLLCGVFVAGMIAIGAVGPYTITDWLPGAAILGVAYLVILGFVAFRGRRFFGPLRLAVVLSVLTVLSGSVWAFTTPVPWRAERVAAETVAYGAPVSELLASRVESVNMKERPGRQSLPEGYDLAQLRDVSWNSVFFTGEAAIGGYVNLKGYRTALELETALLDPESGEAFAAFLSAPGRAVTSTTDSDLSKAEMLSCGVRDACGVVELVPSGYSTGALDYRVSAPVAVEAIFNESYYEGWSLEACTQANSCTELEVQRDETGLVQATLPQGEYMLELRYQSPGRVTGWILFGLGSIIIIVSTLALSRPYSRKKADTP